MNQMKDKIIMNVDNYYFIRIFRLFKMVYGNYNFFCMPFYFKSL